MIGISAAAGVVNATNVTIETVSQACVRAECGGELGVGAGAYLGGATNFESTELPVPMPLSAR